MLQDRILDLEKNTRTPRVHLVFNDSVHFPIYNRYRRKPVKLQNKITKSYDVDLVSSQ